MSPRRVLAVLVAFGLLTSAAHAAATLPITPATPITIGPGENATVTVDATGTAHIAYLGVEPGANTLHYCAIPRGATACSVQTTLPTDPTSTSLEHPLVVLNGTAIQVVSYRYGNSTGPFSQDLVYTSTDGGASFGPGVSVGVNPFHLAIPGPGNTVSTITDADSSDGGTLFQRVPLDGSSAGTTRANLSTSHLYEGALGLVDANTLIATMSDASDNTFWRESSAGGDPNDVTTWTPEQSLGVARTPHFAYGPAGVFLIGGDSGVLKSHKFNGSGFDAPVDIPAGDGGGEVPQSFATQDASGRMHVTLPQITAQCCKLLYATSDDGTHWAARQFQLGTDLPGQTEVAAAADHIGFAVWHTGTGSSAQVQALPVGPTADVPTLGKSAGVTVVSGVVLIQVPGSSSFKPLLSGDVIPVGSLVDATKGRVRVTIAVPGGKQASSDFFQGIFRLTQAKTGLATMVLAGGNLKACGKSAAVRAAKTKVIRQLWGDGKGKFATKGRFASATIRGTTWDTIDRCDGTLVKVTKGSVLVNDLKAHKKVVVKSGHSYLAKR
jgi:hypothetical protein